jgi:hypothetical protein
LLTTEDVDEYEKAMISKVIPPDISVDSPSRVTEKASYRNQSMKMELENMSGVG